jgi:hypothetical protein
MREELSAAPESAGINLQSVPDVSRPATFLMPLRGKRITKQLLGLRCVITEKPFCHCSSAFAFRLSQFF